MLVGCFTDERASRARDTAANPQVTLLATGNVLTRWAAEALPLRPSGLQAAAAMVAAGASPAEHCRTFDTCLSGGERVSAHGRRRPGEGPGPAAGWPPLELAELAGAGRRAGARNVVVVGVETARADVFGPWRRRGGARWGGGPSATPEFDKLARRGRPVSTAYTPTPNTIKAVLALYCGLAPEVSMAWSEFAALDLSECLPAVLRAQGFSTAVFTSGSLKAHAITAADRLAMARHPELKLDVPAQVYCVGWYADFEFRVA